MPVSDAAFGPVPPSRAGAAEGPLVLPVKHGQGEAAPLWNVANMLTILRIIIVPFFLLALFAGGGHESAWRIGAFTLFVIAAVTDRIDGQLARKYGLITEFGKLLDPIADKALMGAALIGLSVLGDLSWWVTGIILSRELCITLFRFAVLRNGVIPASRGGKLKTLVQAVAIGFYVLPLTGTAQAAASWLMWLAVALTVLTGLDYLWQAVRARAR